MMLLPQLKKRGSAVATTLMILAATACSGSIAKNARDDRGNAVDPDGNPATTAGTPTGVSGPPRCTEAKAETERQPVHLMFVVDGSNSMRDDGKWQAVVESMKLIIDQVTDSGVVHAGMIGYADKNDPTDIPGQEYGPYPTSVDIPIQNVDGAHGAALKGRLINTEPEGITPTWFALEGGYKTLRAYAPPPSGTVKPRKVLVLITDGFPLSFMPSEEQVAKSIARAQAEAQNPDPILTFAVGIGAFPGDGVEFDPTFPGRLAYVGGTAQSPDCNPYENTDPAKACHFQVTPGTRTPEQLREDSTAAINAIRIEFTSCDFKVQPPPAGFQLDSRQITVRYKAPGATAPSPILPGATQGWSVDNAEQPTFVRLNGQACEKYRQAGGSVEVILACR